MQVEVESKDGREEKESDDEDDVDDEEEHVVKAVATEKDHDELEEKVHGSTSVGDNEDDGEDFVLDDGGDDSINGGDDRDTSKGEGPPVDTVAEGGVKVHHRNEKVDEGAKEHADTGSRDLIFEPRHFFFLFFVLCLLCLVCCVAVARVCSSAQKTKNSAKARKTKFFSFSTHIGRR